MNDLSTTPLSGIRELLDTRQLSAVELTQHFLDRIAVTQPQLNGFITVTDEHARTGAEHAQREIDQHNATPMTGLPYAAKDLFCTKHIRTTAASKILDHYIPPYSATVIERCGDAILLGKNNLDEFAMGSSSEYSAYGPVRNPYDLTRVPGGSSGGSAAAVAAGEALFTLGTDTSGSIRLPAAFCHVVGFKPTYGRISRYGVIAMTSSLDTVGTFTRNVEDAAWLLGQLAGSDGFDSTASDRPVDDYLMDLKNDINGLRIGVPREYLEVDGIDAGVKEVFAQVVRTLEGLGAIVVEVSLPHTQYALPAYCVLSRAEISSNLARFDGMQFGRPDIGSTLDEVMRRTRSAGFGPEVKRRIMTGTYCLSAGHYDAFYRQAQQVATLVREDFGEAFRQVDLLLSPTSPTVPFKLGERDQNPLAMYAADLFVAPSSLAGVPAISVPAGLVEGLPVGAQLIGPQFAERTLLQVAYQLEQALNAPRPVLAV
jgi:aspartyl-tRNA(Asn)/glutamyl-tRNA(Gln) amidotransferase subunit A